MTELTPEVLGELESLWGVVQGTSVHINTDPNTEDFLRLFTLHFSNLIAAARERDALKQDLLDILNQHEGFADEQAALAAVCLVVREGLR